MTNKISLMTLVKQECCNFVSNECLGFDIYSKGFRSQGICHISEKRPCPYFEKCVLPLAPELTEQYSKPDSSVLVHESKRCKCGKEIDSNKRKCIDCKAKVRRLRNKRHRRL